MTYFSNFNFDRRDTSSSALPQMREIDTDHLIDYSIGTKTLLAEEDPDRSEVAGSEDSLPNFRKHSGASKVQALAHCYKLVKYHLLRHQSQTLGLFCHDTTLHNAKVFRITSGRMCHVRESIYCAITCWALGQAYRLVDSDGGRTHELEQSAVKCMRGILFCWMRQAHKLEAFKNDPRPANALHVVFDAVTGDEIDRDFDGHPSSTYPHLQLDIPALFILTLTQFTFAGQQVIWTNDEVSFVQNLVYYIERSYRVSDFGFWERGTKYNNGEPELHASSLGFVKAALESINGFDIFGRKRGLPPWGSSASVIYVDLDAHNRNQTTLMTLLPRESSSKNTDMALLTTIGFPTFAVSSHKLRQATKNKVVRKLKGNYGLKRYLRDGMGCKNEDKKRIHYTPTEIQNFDGIESQWPLGIAMLHINAMFAGEKEDEKEYADMLERVLITDECGLDVLPKYYYVKRDEIADEKRCPNSTPRHHSNEGENGTLFLLGQSMLVISKLLSEGLLQPSELDPMGRHVAHASYEDVSTGAIQLTNYTLSNGSFPGVRYSKFHVRKPRELCIQVCVIAETTRLQSLLTTYGILSQTPRQIEPIQICSPSELVKAYSNLGRNKKLKLSGRPLRPFGPLSTSKIYRIRGRTVVAFPLVFQQSDFYICHDMAMLVDDIRELIRFVWESWSLWGRPLICCIVREENFGNDQLAVRELLRLLTDFRRGECSSVPIKLGRMQTFLEACCCEHLDFLSDEKSDYKFEPAALEGSNHSTELFTDSNLTAVTLTETSSLTDVRRYSCHVLPQNLSQSDVRHYSTDQILNFLYQQSNESGLDLQSQLLTLLMQREGLHFNTSEGTVEECLNKMIRIAAVQQHWSVVRHCSGLLRKQVDSLAPSVTGILARGNFVTVGVFGREEELISCTLTPDQIHTIINRCCFHVDPREAVLQQEMLINCSKLAFSRPELFKGMLKIRIGWIIQAMREEVIKLDITDNFYALSPRQMRDLLRDVLEIDVTQRCWAEQRRLDGSLNKSPVGFYDKFWHILQRCPEGVRLGRSFIPQQPTLSEMTIHDLRFAILVEDMLCCVSNPSYRQMLIELVMIAFTVFDRNPEFKCMSPLNLDQLMHSAVKSYALDYKGQEGHPDKFCESDDQLTDKWFSLFYNLSPQVKNGTVKYMINAIMEKLLSSDLDISPHSTDLPCHVQ